MVYCIVDLLNACVGCSRLLETDGHAKGCVGWFSYKYTTGEVRFLTLCSIQRHNSGADWTLITGELGKVPVEFGSVHWTTRSEASRAVDGSTIQLVKLVCPNTDKRFQD